MGASDCLIDRFEIEFFESLDQVTIHIANNAWASVNESGVHLNQRGTGADHLPSVFAVHDSADANDGHFFTQPLIEK